MTPARSSRRSEPARRPTRTSARRRRLGQHFLSDSRILARLLREFAPAATDRVLEVGPGRGALTDRLAGQVGRLLAVEVDARLAEGLRRRYGDRDGVEILEADILEVDLDSLAASLGVAAPGRARVVGNLPYRIATPLLARLLPRGDLFSDLTIMVQREVALRLLAAPGEADYGPLAILAALYCGERRSLMSVPPGAFSPPPAVQSTVIAMALAQAPDAAGVRDGLALARIAFQQRRKKLVNALAAPGREPERIEAALGGLGLAVDVRPTRVAPTDWISLAAALSAPETV